jgi:hypothetical protein
MFPKMTPHIPLQIPAEAPLARLVHVDWDLRTKEKTPRRRAGKSWPWRQEETHEN